MANTFTQIHIQAIAAVKFRNAVITPLWKERLHQYISGIVRGNGHKMLAINAMPDHLHFFCGFRPTQSISDFMQIVKGESSEWINDHGLTESLFRWQEGYGAFSYARCQVSSVIDYIKNQEVHHGQINFLDEYRQFLMDFHVEFDEKYIFKPPE